MLQLDVCQFSLQHHQTINAWVAGALEELK